MTYALNGVEVPASTPTALVDYMRETSFTDSSSREAFMVATAARTAEQFGTEIRSDTAVHFVADLIKVGLVKEIR